MTARRRRFPIFAHLAAGLAVPCLCGAAAAQDDPDVDDVLGGFERGAADADAGAEAGEQAAAERIWDLSGSVEISGSVNYLAHRSDTGTNYQGLQRLRNRGNLQLDVDVPPLSPLLRQWKLRLEGWGFYDAAYAINGRSNYTSDVRRHYELDAEVGEAWLAGGVGDHVDVVAGRQVVIWGRSETVRVLDVLNPLDNREPGRVDLEDIRRPVSMVNVKGYAGDWSAALIAIPEIRFDANPVVGSDFFPGAFEPGEKRPDHFEDTELAGSITGIFRGWDVSFHGAWFWNDLARANAPVPTRLVHDRLWMVGSGGNYALGGWLFKYELAYFDGFGFAGVGDRNRIDALLGIEYYGLADTTFVLEVVERHLFEYQSSMRRAPSFTREDTVEIAARISRNFWNDTLHATLVALAFGADARDGSIVRFDLDYDVLDALTAGVGILLYQQGDLPPLDAWADNDRVIFNVKWSF